MTDKPKGLAAIPKEQADAIRAKRWEGKARKIQAEKTRAMNKQVWAAKRELDKMLDKEKLTLEDK